MAADIVSESLNDLSIAQAIYSDSFQNYLELWDLMHSNIEFWVAVTFSSIVAINFLGTRVTKGLRIAIGSLYLAFSVHMLILVVNIIYQITAQLEIGLKAADAVGITFDQNPIGNIGLIWLGILFVSGVAVTTVYIFGSNQDESSST